MNRIQTFVLTSIAASTLAACSSNKSETPKLDYQSENRKTVNLEVPPDLTNPNQGNLYQLPAGSGAVRASDVNRSPNAVATANQEVLAGVKGVKLQREGSQRWLEISGKKPAEIWPLLKAFWQESGFEIGSEEPAIGQMETDWAQNRAKLPNDGIRSLFEKVGLGGIYSTAERDKFIIRVEAGKNGNTDVFFAHKGMQEVYSDKNEDQTIWQPRPSDVNLEAAFLGRFMQYLGADEKQVAQELASNQANKSGNQLAKLNADSVSVLGDYERNWNRVALALDRIGLTVLGQNKERQAFMVEVAPKEADAMREDKPGFIARLFGKKASEAAPAKRLIAYVERENNGANIRILNQDGSAYQGKELSTWLARLHQELR
ncbi:MAG: outer membrane protein assembly factor BamC [Neisseria sp.]|nr:outer membrane protein assembly factor BamC [Neisseria sp.]